MAVSCSEQLVVIAALLQFDAHERRAGFFVRFFHVLKPCDVVGWAEYVVDELFQCAGPLGKTDQEVVFQPFVLQGPLLDFGHPVNVVVAARHHTNHIFASYFSAYCFQRRDAQRACRFGYDGVFVVQLQNRGANRPSGTKRHSRAVRPGRLEKSGPPPASPLRHPQSGQGSPGSPARLFEASCMAGRAFWFHANDGGFGEKVLKYTPQPAPVRRRRRAQTGNPHPADLPESPPPQCPALR